MIQSPPLDRERNQQVVRKVKSPHHMKIVNMMMIMMMMTVKIVILLKIKEPEARKEQHLLKLKAKARKPRLQDQHQHEISQTIRELVREQIIVASLNQLDRDQPKKL